MSCFRLKTLSGREQTYHKPEPECTRKTVPNYRVFVRGSAILEALRDVTKEMPVFSAPTQVIQSKLNRK